MRFARSYDSAAGVSSGALEADGAPQLEVPDEGVGRLGVTGLVPGCLLFLEEVNEPPYKIDGMLCALREGGWLDGVRGVVLGDFTRCLPRKGYRELRLSQVLRDHLHPLRAPAWSGLCAGHGPRNYPIPFGARASLGRGRLVYEEGIVS